MTKPTAPPAPIAAAAVVPPHAVSGPLTPAQLGDAGFPFEAFQHDPDLLFCSELPTRLTTNLFDHGLGAGILLGTHARLLSLRVSYQTIS